MSECSVSARRITRLTCEVIGIWSHPPSTLRGSSPGTQRICRAPRRCPGPAGHGNDAAEASPVGHLCPEAHARRRVTWRRARAGFTGHAERPLNSRRALVRSGRDVRVAPRRPAEERLHEKHREPGREGDRTDAGERSPGGETTSRNTNVTAHAPQHMRPVNAGEDGPAPSRSRRPDPLCRSQAHDPNVPNRARVPVHITGPIAASEDETNCT
jgi:hypothetical protein